MSQNVTDAILAGPPFGPVVNGTLVIIFYEYLPTAIGGYLFMSLFALTTLISIILMFFRPRSWYCIPLVLGGIAETFGYYGRARSHDNPTLVGPWILQNLLLLAAAPLIAATMYMTLKRLVTSTTNQQISKHPPNNESVKIPRHLRQTTPLFITIDFLCLASQFAGAIMPASGDPTAIAISQKVILGGLAVQLLALISFFALTMNTHQKMKAEERSQQGRYGLQELDRPEDDQSRLNPPHSGQEIRGSAVSGTANINKNEHRGNRIKYFRALEVMTILLAIRSLVRMVEYAQGFSGFVASHEVFIYLFDAVPMWIITVIFIVFHPQRLVREERKKESLLVGPWK